MLILFPTLTGLLLFINLSAAQCHQSPEECSVRKSFVETLIILGGFVALSTEILGLMGAINLIGVAVCWGLFLVANTLAGLKWGLLQRGLRQIKSAFQLENRLEVITLVLIMIVLSLVLFTGLLSPPNNYDSQLYHMPRVAHWIQNGNLFHYATSYINQLAFPILAEEGILHLWLLWGSDALSSFVQWCAFGACIVIASYLAKLLGASRSGEWLAVFFVLSLPTVLLQSSSTQNDIVTGLWFLCFLVYLVKAFARPLKPGEFGFCGAALGSGLLTKGTFYPYIIAPLVFLIVMVVKKTGWKLAFKTVIIMAGVVLLLNAGYWIRNILTFQTPLGSPVLINSLVSGSAESVVYLNPLRNLALNFLTPYESLNYRLFGWLFSIPANTENTIPAFLTVFGWNNEDYAGNPIHMMLIVGSFVLPILDRGKKDWKFIAYSICIISCFLLFSISLRYNEYLLRLEIPFFLAAASIFGYVAGKYIKPGWVMNMILLLLFVIAIPWCLFNKYRPLIALKDYSEPLALPSHWIIGNTAGSILLEPQTITFFIHSFSKHDPYIQMMEKISSSQCREIGLRIDSSDPEYPFWWLLSAPQSGYRLESMYVLPETERYIDPLYHPCAMICTICDQRDTLDDLHLIEKYADAKLYLEADVNP